MNWCGIFPCEPDWSWDTATTPLRDFDLWAVFEGRGTMAAPGATVTVARGDCLLLRPNERYVVRTEPAQPLLVHVVHFDFIGARSRVVRPDTLPPLHRQLLDVTFYRELTTRVIQSHLGGRLDEADLWLRAALRELEAADDAHAAIDRADPRAQRIENMCADIARAPERRWVVSEMARACAVSPDHFTRLFKELRGVTPRRFILRQRVDAAKRLLLASSHSVYRIAELTGFSDIYHFSRQFKAHAGRSPTAFRRGK